MPSLSHEEIAELFRTDPALAVELARGAGGIDLPAYDRLEVKPGDLVELIPASYRADVVVLLVAAAPVFAIIVEVQLGKDPDKLYSWPLYVMATRARYRCPTCLIVYAPDPATASWASRPIDLGQPGSPFKPLVRGPEAIPRVTDRAEAMRDPYRAVLSAIAHGHGPHAEAIGRAAWEATGRLGKDERDTWEQVILLALDHAARAALEAWMNIEGFAERTPFYLRGEARGQARALLAVLKARGLEVSTEIESRVLACTDTAQLEGWVRRAATVASVDEVFASSR